MTAPLHILMVAAENDGIETPKGQEAKAGGIADVVRDTPPALAALSNPDCRITVVVPSYGFLNKLKGAEQLPVYDFPFAGSREGVVPFEVKGKKPDPKVRHLVLHNPRFESRHPDTNKLTIYCNDPPGRPFATDATKYACFCAAVAEGLKRNVFRDVNRLHLHDWHAAFLLILRRFDPDFEKLKGLRAIYTIHNLALQGIRPFHGNPLLLPDPSSLATWYPNLILKDQDKLRLIDPEYQYRLDPKHQDCLNPMAVGIRLSDAVHAVSPGYKVEILEQSLPRRSDNDAIRFGGEGLENDLRQADQGNRLFGILNGCDYDSRTMPPRDFPAYQELLNLIQRTLARVESEKPDPVHRHALERISDLQLSPHRPETLLTCVTRAVNQKLRLMQLPEGRPALDQILQGLPASSLLILLGTGDENVELFLSERRSERNFLFLKFFDTACAASLYANGDLFLMPSSFEPCGISQMLAMRDGQPCVVHNVGGLKDTVEDGRTGFSFSGDDPKTQAERFIETVFQAVRILRTDPDRYQAISEAAFQKRFLWSDSVTEYVDKLYR